MIETPNEIRPAQDEIDWFYQKYFVGSEPQKEPPRPRGNLESIFGPPTWAGNLSDDEVLVKARAAANGAQFERLYGGDWSGDHPSQSEADLALLNHLAFWCNRDAEQMARLFSLSSLASEKWQKRPDYRNRTIAKAIAGCRDTYSGGVDRGYGSTGGAPVDFRGQQQGEGDQEQSKANWQRIEPLDVDAALDNTPPPLEWHIEGYIPKGNVGIVTGTGGVGKSYQIIMMAIVKATGRTIPPFATDEPGRVLLLNVEDPEGELARRLHYLVQEYGLSPQERQLLRENLIILPGRGQVKPFMMLEYSTPTEQESFQWFKSVVEHYDPALIFLDTKSRLYGLEENSTDHATRWLGLFESLLVPRPGMTVKIVSHTSKANAQSESAHADRGGSGFPDNARTVLVLCRPQDGDLKRLDPSVSPKRYVKLVVAKQSYGKEAPPVFFEKNDHGVPVKVELRDVEAEARSAALDLLVDILRADHPNGLGKRVLDRVEGEICKGIRDEIMERTGIKAGAWKAVIQFGIESGRLIIEEDNGSTAKNKPQLIRARVPTGGKKEPDRQPGLY